jgi:signal transduction histidine kinase
VPGYYAPSTVLFSIVTAVLAGFVAFEAAGRTRRSRRPAAWALAGGTVLGLGIWSMHFIGMLAWQPPFPLFYALKPTMVSVLVAVAASCLAMFLATRVRQNRVAQASGAVMVGAGICSMHYIGMSAMRFTVPPMWNRADVALSLLIAVSASWVAMRMMRTSPEQEAAEFRRQMGGSLIIGAAICGMHYVGMHAMMLMPGTLCVNQPGAWTGMSLAQLGVGNALLFMLVLLAFSYYDKLRLGEAASQARQQAEQARRDTERLEAASKIAASVAHEVNNPLEAVTNLLFLIGMGEIGAQERAYLEAAQSELRRIAEITTHTLKFHRQQSAPEPTVLPELFESALALFAQRIQARGVLVERAWPADLPPLLCRAGEVRQVFANLVSNAIDAVPDEGGSVRISAARGASGVEIRVADNGRGIAPEVRGRIFQPFFTTKGPAGTGLGLALSSEIVARHGGELSFVTSTVPGASGTTFVLRLPAEPALPGVAWMLGAAGVGEQRHQAAVM